MPAAHQAPVGVEFLCQDHRQRGVDALPELQPIDRHLDLAIAGDLHEGRRLFGRLQALAPGPATEPSRGRKGAEREAPAPASFRKRRRGRVVTLSSDCAPSGAARHARIRVSMAGNMAAPSGQGFGGVGHGGANAGVGATAADVAVHGNVDSAAVGLRVGLEQCGRTHDLAALAIAALGDVVLDPRGVHGLRCVGAMAARSS